MSAREKAVYYLNMRPRTKVQVIKYLKEKGYEDEEIYEAVNELEEYHYIDDFRFSQMYFEYGFEKGRGISRIKRELSEKGVSSDVIEIAYDELEYVPDQFETALEIGRSVIAGIDTDELDYESRRKLQAKIGRRLAGRGFPAETAYKVMNRLL